MRYVLRPGNEAEGNALLPELRQGAVHKNPMQPLMSAETERRVPVNAGTFFCSFLAFPGLRPVGGFFVHKFQVGALQ